MQSDYLTDLTLKKSSIGIHGHIYNLRVSSCYLQYQALPPGSCPFFQISPIMLDRSDAILDSSDPNIILGPHKHRPTECLLENGDPLLYKQGRKIHTSADDVPTDMEKLMSSSAALSADLIDTTPPSSQLTCPADSSESGDDCTSDGVQAIAVDDSDKEGGNEEGSSDRGVTEEGDDAELGM